MKCSQCYTQLLILVSLQSVFVDVHLLTYSSSGPATLERIIQFKFAHVQAAALLRGPSGRLIRHRPVLIAMFCMNLCPQYALPNRFAAEAHLPDDFIQGRLLLQRDQGSTFTSVKSSLSPHHMWLRICAGRWPRLY